MPDVATLPAVSELIEHVSRCIAGDEQPAPLSSFLTHPDPVFRNYRYAGQQTGLGIGAEIERRRRERRRFIHEFGFAIPCREAIDLLASHAPLVEIGAGTAMWSALLARRGVDVIATDPAPAGEQGFYGFVVGAHHPTVRLQGKTAVRRYCDRNVFCSWPTLNHTWFRQAVRAMRIGRRLIVVRDTETAEASAWDYVERAFEFEAELEIPCFYRVHDHIEVHLKKREPRRDQDEGAVAVASEQANRQ